MCIHKFRKITREWVAVTKFKLFRRNCITFTSLSGHSQKIKVEDGNVHNLFAVCFHKILEITGDY